MSTAKAMIATVAAVYDRQGIASALINRRYK
ncbi:MAG: hypothetical protein QG602_2393 [Verrucomicrobiota bacterium]|nr:hypothetical protein [Verrucomicrobiota bacterium]